ncbi:MAG: DUF1828 domain-containing protein [Bacilli bacterium]
MDLEKQIKTTEEFLEYYFPTFRKEKFLDGYLVSLEFYFQDNDHLSSFFIRRNEDGTFFVHDFGNALDYLSSNADISDYDSKIENICVSLGLKQEKNLITRILPSLESKQTMIAFSHFIQGISLIGYLYLE